ASKIRSGPRWRAQRRWAVADVPDAIPEARRCAKPVVDGAQDHEISNGAAPTPRNSYDWPCPRGRPAGSRIRIPLRPLMIRRSSSDLMALKITKSAMVLRQHRGIHTIGHALGDGQPAAEYEYRCGR